MIKNKIYLDYGVNTRDEKSEIVTSLLGIDPTGSFNMGDVVESKFSPSIITRPWGVWKYSTPATISENIDLKPHLKILRDVFEGKFDDISKLMEETGFECALYITVETENAGEGFDLDR